MKYLVTFFLIMNTQGGILDDIATWGTEYFANTAGGIARLESKEETLLRLMDEGDTKSWGTYFLYNEWKFDYLSRFHYEGKQATLLEHAIDKKTQRFPGVSDDGKFGAIVGKSNLDEPMGKGLSALEYAVSNKDFNTAISIVGSINGVGEPYDNISTTFRREHVTLEFIQWMEDGLDEIGGLSWYVARTGRLSLYKKAIDTYYSDLDSTDFITVLSTKKHYTFGPEVFDSAETIDDVLELIRNLFLTKKIPSTELHNRRFDKDIFYHANSPNARMARIIMNKAVSLNASYRDFVKILDNLVGDDTFWHFKSMLLGDNHLSSLKENFSIAFIFERAQDIFRFLDTIKFLEGEPLEDFEGLGLIFDNYVDYFPKDLRLKFLNNSKMSFRRFIRILENASEYEYPTMAYEVLVNQDILEKMDPTLDEIVELENVNSTKTSLGVHMVLKDFAFANGKVRTAEDFVRITDLAFGDLSQQPVQEYYDSVHILVKNRMKFFRSLKPNLDQYLRLRSSVLFKNINNLVNQAFEDGLISSSTDFTMFYSGAGLRDFFNRKGGSVMNEEVMKNLPLFFKLDPSVEEAIALMDQNGISGSKKLEETVLRGMFTQGFINNGDELYKLINFSISNELGEDFILELSRLVTGKINEFYSQGLPAWKISSLKNRIKQLLPESYRNEFEKTMDLLYEKSCRYHDGKIIEKLKGEIEEVISESDKTFQYVNGKGSVVVINERASSCGVCFYTGEQEVRCGYTDCGEDTGMCFECFKNGIDGQRHESSYPLTCSFCHRDIKLGEEMLSKLKIDSDEFNIQRETILSHHRSLFPENFQCQTSDCINRFKKSELDESNHLNCNECEKSYCPICNFGHKEYKSCEEFLKYRSGEDEFRKTLHDPRSNLRPCPYCRVPTEKSEACDHMTCTSCQKKWDWRLGKTIGSTHYSKIDGSEPRLYRIVGDGNQKTGVKYNDYFEDITDDLL